jgi:hypothetical protein
MPLGSKARLLDSPALIELFTHYLIFKAIRVELHQSENLNKHARGCLQNGQSQLKPEHPCCASSVPQSCTNNSIISASPILVRCAEYLLRTLNCRSFAPSVYKTALCGVFNSGIIVFVVSQRCNYRIQPITRSVVHALVHM